MDAMVKPTKWKSSQAIGSQRCLALTGLAWATPPWSSPAHPLYPCLGARRDDEDGEGASEGGRS